MGEMIIRINMTTLSTKTEAVPGELKGLGGRGLTSTIVAMEVPPTCEPLGSIQQAGVRSGPLDGHRGLQLGTAVRRLQEPADRRHQGK